mgnify:FL=1
MSVASNVLDRDFIAGCPDEKWTADITYIHTDEGYLYLAAVMDQCFKKDRGILHETTVDPGAGH